jgi:hypothetical protein
MIPPLYQPFTNSIGIEPMSAKRRVSRAPREFSAARAGRSGIWEKGVIPPMADIDRGRFHVGFGVARSFRACEPSAQF